MESHIYIYICHFTICISGALAEQKNASDLLDLEIQVVLSHLM